MLGINGPLMEPQAIHGTVCFIYKLVCLTKGLTSKNALEAVDLCWLLTKFKGSLF